MLSKELNWRVKEKQGKNYLELCREAAGTPTFNKFKSDSRITSILEHCPFVIALNYYKQVERDNPKLLDNKDLFENDNYGTPFIQDIFGLACSTSTMQYIGVLSNIIKYFGDLTGKNIIEIGAGYGGQAMVIMNMFKVGSYTIIDLEDVNRLQERYLKGRGVKIYNNNYTKGVKYDLVISNYALSEITEPMQSKYIKDILVESKHGYITCNHPLEVKLPPHKVVNDVKGEREGNFIIYW